MSDAAAGLRACNVPSTRRCLGLFLKRVTAVVSVSAECASLSGYVSVNAKASLFFLRWRAALCFLTFPFLLITGGTRLELSWLRYSRRWFVTARRQGGRKTMFFR